jgi:hypothetical protein
LNGYKYLAGSSVAILLKASFIFRTARISVCLRSIKM